MIPNTIEEITTEWLTGALTKSGVLRNNSIRTLNRKIMGEGMGYAGTLTRLSLEYEQPDDTLPATLIAKIPTQVTKSKMLHEALWGLFDPCFFLLNNCKIPLSLEQVEELIRMYHQGLVEGGVTHYSLDECRSDYPFGLLLAVRLWLIIIGGIEVEKDPNALRMLGVLLDRMKPVIEGIDLTAIPQVS